tara:strand:+ start:214 stop:1059 length:846 start_codon:yes stop_codon:yes gene_type:complete
MQKQTEKELMQKIQRDCLVDNSVKMDYPPVALSLGKKRIKTNDGDLDLPIPIGTYGNFSFVQAPPKTKKTFFISLLSSVYLSGSNNFGGDIKGHRTDQCLLHIDTEQGKWHAQRVFKRAIDMSEMDGSQCYYTFALREIGYKKRIEFIEYLLKSDNQNIGVLIIDGIADLVSDVNNLEESNGCIQKLMEWSSIYNLHIITVIHSNFGSDKPTGHLGSFLEKKAETQIQLEANTVNKEWVTVKCKRSRGYAFETFSFKVNDLGLPEVVGDLYDPLKENGKRY